MSTDELRPLLEIVRKNGNDILVKRPANAAARQELQVGYEATLDGRRCTLRRINGDLLIFRVGGLPKVNAEYKARTRAELKRLKRAAGH